MCYRKGSTSYSRKDKSRTGRDIHLSEMGVKEVLPTNQMKPYLDPVLPPGPFFLGGNEPRLLYVHSVPPAELLHI